MRVRARLCAVLLGLVAGSVLAGGTQTTFTYQGRLDFDGMPANGQFDFEFEPFDGPENGNSLAIPVIVDDVVIQDGLLTLDLDFGSELFNGEPVFLEIRAKPDQEVEYAILLPRQQVRVAPYAIHAQKVSPGSVTSAEIADNSVGSADIDSNEVQVRVDGQCPAGEAIRAIEADGTVSCEVDDIGDDDWSYRPDGTLESNARLRLEPGGLYPVSIVHDSTILSPQLALSDSQDSEYARLSFFNQTQSFVDINNPVFWTIAGRVTGAAENDRLNFYSRRFGDVMALTGDGKVGIGLFSPTSELDVNGGVRIRNLAHGDSADRTLKVQPDGNLVAQAPQTQYYSLSATALGPGNASQSFFRDPAVFGLTETGLQSAFAPVHLPHGATVVEFKVWFIDNDPAPDANLTMQLRYHVHDSNTGFGPMAFVTSDGADSGTSILTDDTISAAQIDNENRNYSVWIYSEAWNPSFRIRSVRIAYVR